MSRRKLRKVHRFLVRLKLNPNVQSTTISLLSLVFFQWDLWCRSTYLIGLSTGLELTVAVTMQTNKRLWVLYDLGMRVDRHLMLPHGVHHRIQTVIWIVSYMSHYFRP